MIASPCRLATTVQGVNMTENNSKSKDKRGPTRIGDIRISDMIELLEDKSSSLFILSEENVIRRATRYVINSMVFEYTILAAILANCIVMALEDHLPNDDETLLTIALNKTENYFLAVFSTETFLKIIAQGFVLHPGSYMRSVWNVMDFFVVATGLVLSSFSTSFAMISN